MQLKILNLAQSDTEFNFDVVPRRISILRANCFIIIFDN
jgi:hypothetical protein